MDFCGKKVLVTGGARRVGREIVSSFAAGGAQVIIHCHHHADEAAALAAALPGSGHRFFACDFADSGSAAELFDFCGQIDILVNNASLYFHDPREAALAEKTIMQVNYRTPAELMELFAAQDISEGCVINILDQEIFSAEITRGAYSVSRRKLADLTRKFALLYGSKNLRFNAVAPGPMIPPCGMENSNMVRTLLTLPLRRKVAVSDLCDAVALLAAADSVTGAILPVDCGQSLPGMSEKFFFSETE